MIFLGNFKKITEIKHVIGLVHYMPFDLKNGLDKTREQLEQEGILVESIPEPQQIESKQAIMYWNPIDKKIFYEYEDIPKSKEDIQQESINNLGKAFTEEKIDSMKKDSIINNLGVELSKLKLEILQIKGGNL